MKNAEVTGASADILREPSQIEEATNAQLVATYNALSGKQIKKFESRDIAMRRVEMAMLAARDADGHTGVPKGASGEVKTRDEIVAKASAKGVPAPEPDTDDDPEKVLAKLPPNSMARQLVNAAKASDPITPRPTKAKPTATPKAAIAAVRATFKGASKPQQGSERNNVLIFIQNHKDRAKYGPDAKGAVTLTELDEHFQKSCKGFVQKLIEKQHLEVVKLPEAQPAAAA